MTPVSILLYCGLRIACLFVPSPPHSAIELVHELAEYLSRRFPDIYRVTRFSGMNDASGWYGLPGIKEITIIPLGKTYNLQNEDPMTVASLLWVVFGKPSAVWSKDITAYKKTLP